MTKDTHPKAPTNDAGRDDDRLANYFRLAEGIADLIGPHCEVVVHSLHDFDASVAKIVNGHLTGRQVGGPITDLGLRVLADYEATGNLTPSAYFTRNAQGHLIKSTTTIIMDDAGKAIGLFCVNLNLSLPFTEVMRGYLPTPEQAQSIGQVENFNNSAADIIMQALEVAIAEIDADETVGAKLRNKTITRRLFERGIFEFKEAIVLAEERMGISRHAIYKFVREFRSQQKSGDKN